MCEKVSSQRASGPPDPPGPRASGPGGNNGYRAGPGRPGTPGTCLSAPNQTSKRPETTKSSQLYSNTNKFSPIPSAALKRLSLRSTSTIVDPSIKEGAAVHRRRRFRPILGGVHSRICTTCNKILSTKRAHVGSRVGWAATLQN